MTHGGEVVLTGARSNKRSRCGTSWLLLALAACSTGPAPLRLEQARTVQEVLVAAFGARLAPLPADGVAVRALEANRVLVFLLRDPRPPARVLPPAARAELRGFLGRGGRLLLLGYAARLACELGLEPRPPSRFGLERWGVSERTAIGVEELGFASAGRDASDGLTPEPGHAGSFLLCGGEMTATQLCTWRRPDAAEVLGRLVRRRDFELHKEPEAVLLRWRQGAGEVLAFGSVPEPWRPKKRLAANARHFLVAAVRRLAGESRPSVVLCQGALPEPLAAPGPLLPLRRQEAAPAGVAWGWQIGLQAPPARAAELLARSARAGAGLFELRIAEAGHGLPFAWSNDDPIARPAALPAEVSKGPWTRNAITGLAGDAHGRGLLVHAELAAPPVWKGSRVARLAGIKWLARELCDVRWHGRGALDGLALGRWIAGPEGYAAELLAGYAPGARLIGGFLDAVSAPGFLPVAAARFGRPRGLEAAGLSAAWRNAFGPPVHRLGVLDADEGHGGYPDWLLTQLGDFVRPRLEIGAALWWRAPAALPPRTESFVHGISLEGLEAAVAARLSATGRGGYRERVRGFLPGDRVQSGFGAESPLPARVAFLQNNHFRLHGSGGPLWLDRSGRAVFRRGDSRTRELTRTFLTARLRGVRPRPEMLAGKTLDFIAGHPRQAWGYDRTVQIEGPGHAGAFPAMLARDRPGLWPRRVELAVTVPPGRYDLLLRLRAVAGHGLLELRRDRELLALEAFQVGEGTRSLRLRCDVVRPGKRVLALELVLGGTLAIDICRLVPARGLGAESRIVQAAGPRAVLEEWSGASFYADRIAIVTSAGLPGFACEIEYLALDPGVEVVRSFDLRAYPRLRRAAAAPGQPFVLAPAHPGLPDLAVVPLELPPGHRLRRTADGRLQLIGHPRPRQRVRIGFVWLRDPTLRVGPGLALALGELFHPPELVLGSVGQAEIHPALPFAWTRVLRLRGSEGGPFSVRERGLWLRRGAQPCDDGGGVWLRIHQVPGDVVMIRTGPRARAGTRPGPGSAPYLGLRDPGPRAVTVEVRRLGPLCAAPSVTMAVAFDQAKVNGEPWSYVDGKTVYLPRRPGRFVVTTQGSGAAPGPRLLRCGADVRVCRFDPRTRTLEIRTAHAKGQSAPRAMAWIAGGEPVELIGCEQESEKEQSYPATWRVRERGFVVRLHPGRARLRFLLADSGPAGPSRRGRR